MRHKITLYADETLYQRLTRLRQTLRIASMRQMCEAALRLTLRLIDEAERRRISQEHGADAAREIADIFREFEDWERKEK